MDCFVVQFAEAFGLRFIILFAVAFRLRCVVFGRGCFFEGFVQLKLLDFLGLSIAVVLVFI